ncbi:MAG: hypothetical protein ACRDM2_06640, partial [Gaiellaceae bacterium]
MGSIAVVHHVRSAPDGAAVERALSAAPHRGDALEVRTLGAVSLGISNAPELTDAWIASDDGRAAVVTGTLDNADELGLDGGDPAAQVLAAFDAWGADAPARLRGVFSAAWTDGTKLVVFRDQLGLAPLFHRESPDGFVAATEGKQVVAGAGIAREPDVEAVEAMFFGRFDARGTMLRGIERFPRASTATVNGGGPASFHRY